ncbi:hypothetical protein ACRCUN_24515 [Mycobacterium sp. LTG2003]
MATTANNRGPKHLLASIERGLDRMLGDPVPRIREMRMTLEQSQVNHQHRIQVRSTEVRETLNLAERYLRNLPKS